MKENSLYTKEHLFILNQVFEIEQKIGKLKECGSVRRNIDKIKEVFSLHLFGENAGLIIHNPEGESYSETRTDCNASISGTKSENLKIVEVIKPIILFVENGKAQLAQKAVVVVSARSDC